MALQTEGVVTIVGYASLMDEGSARDTTPCLVNWRLGHVDDFCRVFDLVSIINVRRGLASGKHLATCTARRKPGSRLRVCIYDVPSTSYPGLLARERRLREETVDFRTDTGDVGSGQIFSQYSDEEYRAERVTTAEQWHEEVGQYYAGALIYRDDLLPVPSYLQKCTKAFAALGKESLSNFLDCSFLGDGVTPIRSYLGPQQLAASTQAAELQRMQQKLSIQTPPLINRRWELARGEHSPAQQGVLLRVMQFNTLADGLSGMDPDKGGFDCPAGCLSWCAHRGANILRLKAAFCQRIHGAPLWCVCEQGVSARATAGRGDQARCVA
jgi:hypothetical protein